MRKTAQFFLITFFIRVLHALGSLAFHVDGDVSIPWLMANDWEHTLHRRFYWGQDYLGTYETFALAKLGHLFFAKIPLAFMVIAGQLEIALGVTLLFATVRKLRPGFGDHWREFFLAVMLLGFLPPALEKYSFGPGMGFALVPLATGLATWLWVESPRWRKFAFAGIAYGLMITSSRLCVVPCLALLFCLWLAREAPRLIALGAGAFAGLLPELAFGLERSAHHIIAFSPFIVRWHNFANALVQTGVALGLFASTVRVPEDTLWARGHAPMVAHPIWDVVAVLAFIALTWTTRQKLRTRSGWIFAAIAGANFALITLDAISVDQLAARRYSIALTVALSAWLLVAGDAILARAFTGLRLAITAVYLVASTTYASPFGEMGAILERGGFREGDCLSGHGGDLAAAMSLSGQVVDVLATAWRLPGNYSRAVESCSGRIFHISTGAAPMIAGKCEQIYLETERSAYRPPVAVYRCEGSSPQAIPDRTKNNSP